MVYFGLSNCQAFESPLTFESFTNFESLYVVPKS